MDLVPSRAQIRSCVRRNEIASGVHILLSATNAFLAAKVAATFAVLSTQRCESAEASVYRTTSLLTSRSVTVRLVAAWFAICQVLRYAQTEPTG
jgi:hypothetical protein